MQLPTSPSESAPTTIVLAVDGTYIQYVPCMLGQLSLHAKGTPVVMVLAPDVDEQDIERCRDLAARLSVPLSMHHLAAVAEMEASGRVAARDYVSAFTYAKLMFPDVLRDLDEILYLDVDVLVRGDLSPLLGWKLHHPLGAVPEVGVNGMHLHGNVRVPYFNAGVLRMSLARLREEAFWAAAEGIIRHRPRYRFQDQDVFNVLMHDRFDALPLTFNVFNSVAVGNPNLKLFTDPVIVHFTGPNKPWNPHQTAPFAREWRALDADVRQLDPDEAERYTRGVVLKEQSAHKRLVESVRFSPVGVSLRTSLPIGVKRPLHRLIYMGVPEAQTNEPSLSARKRSVEAVRYSAVGRSLRSTLPVGVKKPIHTLLYLPVPEARTPGQGPAVQQLWTTVRMSRTGVLLRSRLPVEVKRPVARGMNTAVDRAHARRKRRRQRLQAKRQLQRQRLQQKKQQQQQRARAAKPSLGDALVTQLVGSRKVPAPGPKLATQPQRLEVPAAVAEVRTTSMPPETRRWSMRRGTVQPRPRLRLLATQARSGTNAFGQMVHTGFEDVNWIGETYAGFVRENHPAHIVERFPWITDLDLERTPGLARDEKAWSVKVGKYRDRMSADVVDVTQYILDNTPGICAAKIFDTHLNPEAVDDLFREFRPPLLVMRRTYLYSLLSWLKARDSNHWSHSENTDARANFDEETVRRFIQRGDRWHEYLSELALRYDLPVSHITYEGVLENRTDLKVIREFFSDAKLTPKARADETWLPKTLIQDRRTDESLTLTLQQFSILPADLRARLLALPGQQAWADFDNASSR